MNVVTGFPQACLEDDQRARVLMGAETIIGVKPPSYAPFPDAKALVAWDRVLGTATATVEGTDTGEISICVESNGHGDGRLHPRCEASAAQVGRY